MTTLEKKAKRFRRESRLPINQGVVIFYAGEVQGWINELRNPESWRPGCIAVDPIGTQFAAIGGNEYDGASEWRKIN